MPFSKLSLLVITLLSAIELTGCQTQSNTVVFHTPIPVVSFNTQNQAIAVSVNTQDLRKSAEISRYARFNNVQTLTAIPDVRLLFQHAMQQHLNSKGYNVVTHQGNVDMLITIHTFFANVEQGNLRHKINADIAVTVKVQSAKGSFIKNFNTSRSYEDIFGADNDSIRDLLNQAYSEIVHSLYNDNELGHAIHQLN